MRRREAKLVVACALALSMLVACGPTSVPTSTPSVQLEDSAGNEDIGPTPGETAVASAVSHSSEASENPGADSLTAAPAVGEGRDSAQEYTWDSSQAVQVVLNGSSIAVNGGGVTVDGSKATITSAGTYHLNGPLADGQIIVNTDDGGMVTLVLDGVDIHSSTSAPIYVKSAEETLIVLADGTENLVSDAESYVLEDEESDEPNAAIFSKDDLTIYGSGSLTVDANFNDGIASKDGLIIGGGVITVDSVDDGIRGKDYIVVKDGNITVSAQGDGLKSDEDADATKGYIAIEGGVIDINCGGDAIQGQTAVMITDGKFNLFSGGGHNARIAESTSAKGIKAGVSLRIDGGTFNIDSADDALHSNGSLVVNGGSFVLATGDDAMHADSTLQVNGGQFTITDSYEGIESAVITINAGDIHIISNDDGINVSAGNDGSGTNLGPGAGGGGRPGRAGPGQDWFAFSGDDYLYINGGYIVIDAAGDGIDVNGSIEMTDGVVIVNGPTEQMNGALDCIGAFNMHGGFLVAAGSAGMAEGPDATSTQYSVLINLNGTLEAGALFQIQNGDGDAVLTFAPTKRYQSVAFSSPELTGGTTYVAYYGGSSTGTLTDGLYQGGIYTPGTNLGSFTLSAIATRLGSGRRF